MNDSNISELLELDFKEAYRRYSEQKSKRLKLTEKQKKERAEARACLKRLGASFDRKGRLISVKPL